MNSIPLILFYSVCVGFVWSNYVLKMLIADTFPKWAKSKPFSCMMCLTGWTAFVLAGISGYSFESVLIACAGWFIGAIISGIIMRYL